MNTKGKEKNTLPRGLRNNNPLNIIRTTSQWEGMAKEQTDARFCQFAKMRYGWRAAFRLLYNYYHRHRRHSVRDIINHWAPASDGNHTEKYIETVSQHLHIEDGADLGAPEEHPFTWISLADMMATVENGKAYKPNMSEILIGWAMAMADKLK